MLSNIGWTVIPFSFAGYFLINILTYKWNMRYKTKPVKTIWYLLNAMMVIDGDVHVDVVAVMILLFEAFDSFMDYFEEKRRNKK